MSPPTPDLFLKYLTDLKPATKISTLHNVWQTVAQLSSNPASDYIARASLADDDQVEQWVDEDGLGKELVGIRRSDSGTGTEIYGVRHRVVSRLT